MECPSCHNQANVTDKNYGALYTCPKCSAVYFVNFDGQPDYGDMQASNELVNPGSESNEPENLADSSFPTEAPLSDIFSTMASLPEDESLSPEPIYPPIEQVSLESEIVFDANQNMFEIAAAEEPQTFESVANEIADYGNQETQVSGLSYDVKITGIDSGEIRNLLKEALEDQRFGWIAQDIVAQIKQGACEIKNLNPLQAFVLAKRIQFLDIEMKWTQNVAT